MLQETGKRTPSDGRVKRLIVGISASGAVYGVRLWLATS